MTCHGKKIKFECDTCHRVEFVDDGLPKDWCFLKTTKGIQHACAICKEQIPIDQQHKPPTKSW